MWRPRLQCAVRPAAAVCQLCAERDLGGRQQRAVPAGSHWLSCSDKPHLASSIVTTDGHEACVEFCSAHVVFGRQQATQHTYAHTTCMWLHVFDTGWTTWSPGTRCACRHVALPESIARWCVAGRNCTSILVQFLPAACHLTVLSGSVM